MSRQLWAILWAQFRIFRNHFKRSKGGAIFVSIFTLLWYSLFLGLGVVAALVFPQLSRKTMSDVLPIVLLAFFLYSQVIPLFTLSTGWSLQLNKIMVYPIRESSLFLLEVILRVSSAPEVFIVMLGGAIGLLRRRDVPVWAALCLLLYIPFNLLIQLALRELMVHGFAKSRFREIGAIILVSIGLLPQLLIRTGLGERLKPYFVLLANGHGTPWQANAALSLDQTPLLNLGILAAWTGLALVLARWQFAKGLVQDDAFRPGAVRTLTGKEGAGKASEALSNLFRDPMAAIVQKELRSLPRMPRFRVTLGMACVFSILLFIPSVFGGRRNFFGGQGLYPFANLYALLLISDMLLLNIFGTDRGAAQLYFASPASLSAVIKAKNAVAWLFILAINLIVAVTTVMVAHAPAINIAAGFLVSTTVAIHLMWVGNLISVITPQPRDPSATTQRSGHAKLQWLILASTIGMAILVGFAYLARWAFNSEWAFVGVLAFEFGVGYVAYRVSLDSAVARGMADRERIISELSKTLSPIAGGSG